MEDWIKIVCHARDVAERLGKNDAVGICVGYIGIKCNVYEDDILRISVTTTPSVDAWLGKIPGMVEIVRKENGNPCIMAAGDNECIRYHGEFAYIKDHFFGL